MRRLNSYTLTATIAADGSGTATTSTDQSIPRGKIYAVEVDYPANTVAVALTSKNLAATQAIMTLSAASTDAIYYPRVPVCTYTGAETIYWSGTAKVCEQFVIFGALIMTLSSGTAGQVVTMKIYIEEY